MTPLGVTQVIPAELQLLRHTQGHVVPKNSRKVPWGAKYHIVIFPIVRRALQLPAVLSL